MRVSGQLRKMTFEVKTPVEYFLSLDEKPTPINLALGKKLTMKFSGVITCIACGRKIKKSYDQGYCFPCARDLPENAMCSVRPEKCEHEKGNAADREFYRTHCNIDHFVYLSLTSGVKVGITRHYNVPDRWIDQGAVQAMLFAKVPERILSGKIEVAVAAQMADKTNWRKMLKGEIAEVDLKAAAESARDWVPEELRDYLLPAQPLENYSYPILSVPEKISSHNLDKVPEFTDRLTGIKGQYLIFESRVINLRKYTGYHIAFDTED